MIANATKLANDSSRIIDAVYRKGEVVEIQRRGVTKAVIRRAAGVSKAVFLARMKAIKFTDEERKELSKAINKASKVLGYAGGH